MRKDIEQYIPAMARVLSNKWASHINKYGHDYWQLGEHEFAKDVRAMLSVIPDDQPAAQAVPEGWRLVPVELTPEMLAAVSWPGCAATDYAHMLAAAPTPPSQKQGGLDMAITRGFGLMIDLITGKPRRWYMGGDGIKRWLSNDQPCDVASEKDLWRCTVCGRVGTVGRCCGEDTRIPAREVKA